MQVLIYIYMYIYIIYILIVRFHDINPLFKNGLSRSELINWSRSLTRNFSQAAMCPMLRASYQSNQSTNAGWKNDCGVKKGDMTGDKMSWKKYGIFMVIEVIDGNTCWNIICYERSESWATWVWNQVGLNHIIVTQCHLVRLFFQILKLHIFAHLERPQPAFFLRSKCCT
jgi:hypothetical protein